MKRTRAWWWRATCKRIEQDISDVDQQIWQLRRKRKTLRKELYSAYEQSQAASGIPYISYAEPDELDAMEGGNVVPFVRQ
jgi:hypothetical protein